MVDQQEHKEENQKTDNKTKSLTSVKSFLAIKQILTNPFIVGYINKHPFAANMSIALLASIIGINLSHSIIGSSDSIESTKPNFENQVKINFDEVCESKSHIKKAENELNYSDLKVKSMIIEDPDKTLWPTFLWRCKYSNEDFPEENQKDTDRSYIIGMDLREFCRIKHAGWEPYFKNYMDPNSWYCVKVNMSEHRNR